MAGPLCCNQLNNNSRCQARLSFIKNCTDDPIDCVGTKVVVLSACVLRWCTILASLHANARRPREAAQVGYGERVLFSLCLLLCSLGFITSSTLDVTSRHPCVTAAPVSLCSQLTLLHTLVGHPCDISHVRAALDVRALSATTSKSKKAATVACVPLFRCVTRPASSMPPQLTPPSREQQQTTPAHRSSDESKAPGGFSGGAGSSIFE